VTDVLICGDTRRSPELRHELPVALEDAVLYGETDGTVFAVVSPLDAANVKAARPGIEVPDWFADLGVGELLDAGLSRAAVVTELQLRALRRFGVRRAAVPAAFPLATAEAFRAAGIELVVDAAAFEARRRRKSVAELAGIRRAVAAAEAAIGAAAARLHAGASCAKLERAIRDALHAHGAHADEVIVAHGPATAAGHGSSDARPIVSGEPVQLDVWPRDIASGCHADVARTFVHGDPPEPLAAWHALCLEVRDATLAAIRPGVTGRELWAAACERYEAAGIPTQRTAPPGTRPATGAIAALGHGVGLEAHEAPALGRTDTSPLVEGDVLAIEPFICWPGLGGIQIEDMVLVTATGAERLTSLPDALAP
jgi:Xaa-Pro aminopeptidase